MKNIYDMYDFFESLTDIEDPRQFKKVKYPINEVVGMVLIASLGNANEWTEIEVFCKLHKTLLKKYFKLETGVPSHDTFQRVIVIRHFIFYYKQAILVRLNNLTLSEIGLIGMLVELVEIFKYKQAVK